MTTREWRWSAWTGGKPKYDWSGLDASAPSDYAMPNQLHPIHVSSAQKGYNHQCKGIDNKFAKGSDHFNFARLVWKHLVDTGMDTIAYLLSTKDPQEMVSIVQYYSQYSLKTTREHYKAAKAKFDHYDVNNDAAAHDFLLDLLEPKLCDMVNEKLKDDDGFLVTWFQLIKSIQTTNIEHYKSLKEQVKACHPSQFPGQNVTTLASTFHIYARELNNTYAYDHNLTLMMLETFLLAGGNDNKDYRMDLRIKKKELKKELKIVCHMGYDEAKEHMMKQDLTYKSICEVAENAYGEQANRGKWPPARNIRHNSAAPPASFQAIAPTDRMYTSTEINALFQTKMDTQPTGPKSGNCNRCGKPGHWAKECPNKSQMDANVNNSNNGGRNGGSGCGNGSARGSNVNARSSSNTQDNGQNQHNN